MLVSEIDVMGSVRSLLLLFLLSLVEVHCQTFPYVSFMGQTLVNHSHVDLNIVGSDYSSDSVVYHTDLSVIHNTVTRIVTPHYIEKLLV